MLNEKTQSPKPPHHIGDPWQPNTIFFGRTQDIETISQQLRTNKVVLLLNGIGGMGKTALANQLRYQIGDQYDHVIWTNLQNVADTDKHPLRNHLLYNSIQLHQDLGIAEVLRSEQDETQKWAILVRALRQLGDNVLWIIDNAHQQDQATIDELPDNCRILLTVRHAIGDIPTHYVNELEKETALRLFKHYYTRPDDDQSILDVCKAVGYHALSVELLAKTLNELPNKGASFLLQEFKKRGIGKQTTQAASTDIAAQQTRISHIFEAILQIGNLHRNIPALSVLRIFMYLPCQDILFQLIALLAQKHDPKQQDILQNSLNELVRLGWLRHTSLTAAEKTTEFWQMHPAVWEMLWKKQHKTPKQAERIIDVIMGIAQIECEKGAFKAQVWTPYLSALLQVHNLKTSEQLRLYNLLAHITQALGHHAIASENKQKALALAAIVPHTQNSDLAMLYIEIGVNHVQLGQYDAAISYYKRSCAIWEKNPSANLRELGGAYLNIALSYYRLSEYHNALSYFERCRAMWSLTNNLLDADWITFYMKMGEAYYMTKQYNKALTCYKSCEAIQKESLPPQHPDWANLYLNMANTYDMLTQYELALDYYERYITIRQPSLSAQDPSFAIIYMDMGDIYLRLGQYDTAITHYKHSQTIHEQNPVLSTHQLGILFLNMATTHSKLGQSATALSLYEQCAAILEQILPDNDSDLGILYLNMSSEYKKLEQYATALQYCKRCLAIWEQILPPLHLYWVNLYNNMEACYSADSQFEKALEYVRKNVAICQQTLPENNANRIAAERRQVELMLIVDRLSSNRTEHFSH
ncbi:MAG TPA: tetratricopeptide repeat protein [Chitinophagales bacterium]|nr:tetratricopeptide repeat protein [Chitinophagales bacterium]